MTEERQIEELARMDDLNIVSVEGSFAVYDFKDNGDLYYGPMTEMDYMNDHNAIQRVIDAMDSCRLGVFVKALSITSKARWSYGKLLRATCEQKAEAILRAVGKWEEK